MDLPAGEPLCITTTDLPERCFVSLLALVATPERFHHRHVQVTGYLKLGFENNVLYLSKEASRFGDSESAIWVDIEGIQNRRLQDLNGRYVIIAGTFNAENRGHLGGFAGTLENIFRLDKWK